MKKITLILAAAVAILSTPVLRAESKQTREFRPLEAKKVVFAPAAQVSASDVDGILSEGWGHFDRREWDKAIDRFLTVMEQDTKNKSAAEGLAMSVYRTSDYKAAYRLSVEFANFMPEISEKIAAVVLADVRYMIQKDQRTAARELLRHFPKTDLAFAHAHTLVESADTLARNVGPDEELPTARLAKN